MGITIFKIFIWGGISSSIRRKFSFTATRYTFGNHVLRLHLRVAVKLNFRPYIRRYTSRLRVAVKLNFRAYIRRYTSPNENFEYSYPLNVVSSIHCRDIIVNSFLEECYTLTSDITFLHIKYRRFYIGIEILSPTFVHAR